MKIGFYFMYFYLGERNVGDFLIVFVVVFIKGCLVEYWGGARMRCGRFECWVLFGFLG